MWYARTIPSTLIIALLFISGCMSGRGVSDGGDMIIVEGRVTLYGNVPFERAALVTDDRNWYVLELTDEQRSALVTPSIQRIRGRVYLDDWNSRPFAHLRVHEMERVVR